MMGTDDEVLSWLPSKSSEEDLSVTNLDAVRTIVYEPASEADLPADVGDDQQQQQTAQPVKRLKFDKLGRLIQEEVVVPESTSTATQKTLRGEVSTSLRRPRGRPPKGKVWHDERGWVSQGLGAGLRMAPKRKEMKSSGD